MILKPIEQVLQEYNSLGINQQLDYEKFYLYSIITHSTAIEGSTITEIENQILFDEGIGVNKPMTDQLMNLDLKKAYEKAFELANQHTAFSTDMLCQLSAIVMKNTGSQYNTIAGSFNGANGDLRLLNVSAGRGGKSYVPWQKVPGKLEKFCTWINQERQHFDSMTTEDKYYLSFTAHLGLVSIHPWADGNGRMSRLVMNMLQHEAGIIPSIVKKENRVDYIKALSESQDEEDGTKFLKFMLDHHKSNLLEQIDEYKKSMDNQNSIQPDHNDYEISY